ncbi:protein kinase family protein [Neobacillus vireti]|uniref:Uncharacterized protein n=1 Tax=Neobacillus vireti LMG 21834 TaxID=1131730 RepID=A0AB94IQR4_9BACI|nr:hypothetical protein [Neobacillus vireti]ETI69376.1 hypothetical protein BAVI_08206 [Neobacillus vireti LMG 21834]KLT19804.1 hypothetical protein AA980_04360 [Neobacillus vireti]
MNIVEEYEKEIAGRLVSIVVRHEQDKPLPYYAVSSLNVDGSGKTLEEAKMKCENATKMEISMNR